MGGGEGGIIATAWKPFQKITIFEREKNEWFLLKWLMGWGSLFHLYELISNSTQYECQKIDAKEEKNGLAHFLR